MNLAPALEQIDGPRACLPLELAPTLDVGTAVMRLGQNKPPTWGHSWPHIYCPENLDNIRVIKVNHQVVSSMAIFTTTVQARTAQAQEISLTVGGINGVATLPEFRRRGFAGQLLLDCHAKMRADGCDIALLSTGIDNWYRRFGWEYGAQQWTFTIDRGSCPYLPQLDASIDIEEATMVPSMLAEVGALHRGESLGAQRRPALDSLLLTRLGNRLFVACQNEHLLAYVVVRDNQFLEHGGPPEVVAGLIRTIFEGMDDPTFSTSKRDENNEPWALRMTIHTPPVMEGLGRLFHDLELPFCRAYLGMIHIVNPRQLINKVAPHIKVEEETIEDETEEQIVLREGSSQHRIGRRELVKLLFGPERPSIFTEEQWPLTFYQWPLDWV